MAPAARIPIRSLADAKAMVKAITTWSTTRRDVVRIDLSLTRLPPNDRVILTVLCAIEFEGLAVGTQLLRNRFEVTDRTVYRRAGWIVDVLNGQIDNYRDFLAASRDRL